MRPFLRARIFPQRLPRTRPPRRGFEPNFPEQTRSRPWILACLVLVAGAAGAGSTLDGQWRGAIEIPGNPLEIVVDFTTGDDGELAGAVSIPIQGIQGRTLTDVAFTDGEIRFRIPDIPGDPTFDGELEEGGSAIRGTFSQGGNSLPFHLVAGVDPVAATRAALEGFDDFVEQALPAWNIPGLTLAVVRDGEVVVARGFGIRDRETGEPVTENTLFPIGSTTKAFTCTLLGTLVASGELDWDEPLNRFWPDFRLADPMATAMLTPRDLVTHRSGLPRHDLSWYNFESGTRAELVARLAHLEASAGLREKYQYNNLMYVAAGHLAGRLAGSTWEEAMRERLLEPLGMTATNLSVEDSAAAEDFSRGYSEDENAILEPLPFRNIDLVGPAGSINSTAVDMAKWLQFNLAEGVAPNGERLVDAAILADIHSPHMTTDSAPERREFSQGSYGLGWVIDTYRGHRRVGHGGAIDGFSANVTLYPDDDLGIFVAASRGSALPSIVARHIADRVLELEPIDWNAEGLEDRANGLEALRKSEEDKQEGRVAGTRPTHELADYAGEYGNPGYSVLTVTVAGDGLVADYNGISTPLKHWHYDVWSGLETGGDDTFEGMKYQFRSDVDGNIAAVEAPFEAMLEPIVFRRQPSARLSEPGFLGRLVGFYDLTGTEVEIALSGGGLTASLPGQPVYTLDPALNDRYRLRQIPVITVGFDLPEDGSEATAVTFFQPNGVFRGERRAAATDGE